MNKGKVILVGAGPSDAGLITVKGANALQQADVVVYDKLVGIELLNMIPDAAKKINVGKSGGKHPVPQEQINRILLEEAQKGNLVVRLKGGDPFVFGRGGEELELLSQNGIPFEVIPGITSAISVPCYAGIPVTHRDHCSSLHIITGHTKTEDKPQIDFEALVRLKGTLIFLMGVGAIEAIRKGLLDAGMDSQTPIAMIEKGTTARQRKLISTLENVVFDSQKAQIKPPSVIVVGEVCRLHEGFSWAEQRPLNGKRIIITRPKDLCSSFREKIRALGGEAIDFPCIQTKSNGDSQLVQNAVRNIGDYHWVVFTSATGATLFFETLKAQALDIRSLYPIKIAVIGSGTRDEFKKRGIMVDLMPESYDVEALAQALVQQANQKDKILLFRAKDGSKQINQVLDAHGISYNDVAAYDTVYTTQHCQFAEEIIRSGDYDVAAFTSASTVRGFVNSLNGLDYTKVHALCIGEQTAQEARKHGMQVTSSQQATIDSMVETLIRLGEEHD